jgi:Leucine-rich repeat (LRR) protein
MLIFFTQFCIAQIVNIPDANFKAALIEDGVDTNNDGEIQVTEAEVVTYINVSGESISSLEGINSFINLETLRATVNELTTLDVSSLTNLILLDVFYNSLTEINVSGLTNLESLLLSNNQLTSLDLNGLNNLKTLLVVLNNLTSIDVSNLILLEKLHLANNQLTNINVNDLINLNELRLGSNQLSSLGVSNLTNLTSLSILNNQLLSLNLSGLENLIFLEAWDNQLTSINLTGLSSLKILGVHNNSLTVLDLSDLVLLEYLDGYNNPFISLNIKNGSTEHLAIDYDNTLEYICADNEEVNGIQQEIDDAQTTTIVNSYCSFIPGGEFYIIEGHNNLDIDDNGCDNSDASYPNLQYSITDGTTTGSFISNNSGDYSIYVQDGSHTITPILENPTYFSISPTSFSVNFPADTSPFIQDFCITPLGDFPDLEASIIPLDDARPGFDANYKIIYKNKGTTTINSTLEFTFQDIYMDLVTANPSPDEQIQSLLKWDYTNLLPQESRSIFVTMNINTPTDTPPVNGDDILIFEVSNPITDDENPNDNVAVLNQTVLNSYDPNDKTCIEGEYILPTHIGEYLHYVIRFENTGTASAVNVVIKDIIDISKLDISSLTPTDASHPFITRIKNTNEVEFVFENIQLPFDDENNDGYIAFKIKTLPILELNDIIENNAEIYFDFNAPIITNTYTTKIIEESSTDGIIGTNTISTFPNPTKNQLFINSETSFEKISIFDTSGKLISSIQLSHPLTEYELNISKLSEGIYFLEVQSKNIKEMKKFIKN